MAVSWNNEDWNGKALSIINSTVRAFNVSVEALLNSIETSTTSLLSRMTSAEVRLTANEATIGTNTESIEEALTNAPFIRTYDYAQNTAITVTDDVYENILVLSAVGRAAGVYKLSQSMLYQLNSTTNSAYFRFSLDGGTNWSEIRREPKDNTDVLPSAYTSTVVHAGGDFNLVIQARKENASDILIVNKIDVIFERKV